MDNQQPQVSVLMTAYNREKYIDAAIRSVLASSYSNFELIIVDDGSKDDTVAIANAHAAKDPRIKVYVNEQNLGDYPNRNRAASYATGKYLKYVDADDYIYPWGLRILVNTMEQFPEAGWGLCSLEQDVERPFPFMLSSRETYLYHYNGPGLFHKAPLSAIIKTEVFRRVGEFQPIRMAGDFDMWNRLAQKHAVVLMPHGIVWYREHHAQEMNSYSKFIPVYEALQCKYLTDSNCPVEKDIARQIVSGLKSKARTEIIKGIISLNKTRVKENLVRLRCRQNAQFN